ncbi:MAG: hypothetical protein A2855_01590 [Candidatus Liptonbacteria bacterium RIFCSPHIGHO2_01_FULL_57_28]|uniref:GerMN domain-containing protein n=1 Tax=Candidatus Liptonbacteria bacterium RIFCSPHIGHO2_01_FULL_57_28 TaxID=1798647 RepID=A0A1G2CBU0_9BACT|nr:MAG: hypothetical protein A2855_01590 [Candidatus Liptonbacteria bacterium RIFCSPHIGHO2_01_FULL_57_28]
MNRNQLVAISVILVLVAIGGWFYVDYVYAPKVQAPQLNLAESIAGDWDEISAQIPIKAGESGRWYIDAIRTIGAATALVAFEDGLNGHVAVLSAKDGDYSVLRLYESQLQFAAAELEAIEKQYGDAGFAPQNFGPRADGTGMVPATENFFLKTDITLMPIKIAWLNPEGNLPNEVKAGDVSGCDHVVLQERMVPKSQIPLTAALEELLADKTVWTEDRSLYNYIGQGDLELVSVAIQDGIAKIYLTGAKPRLSGVCDDPRLFIQVAQTARQFPTVQRVELYINGVRNDGSSDLRG